MTATNKWTWQTDEQATQYYRYWAIGREHEWELKYFWNFKFQFHFAAFYSRKPFCLYAMLEPSTRHPNKEWNEWIYGVRIRAALPTLTTTTYNYLSVCKKVIRKKARNAKERAIESMTNICVSVFHTKRNVRGEQKKKRKMQNAICRGSGERRCTICICLCVGQILNCATHMT